MPSFSLPCSTLATQLIVLEKRHAPNSRRAVANWTHTIAMLIFQDCRGFFEQTGGISTSMNHLILLREIAKHLGVTAPGQFEGLSVALKRSLIADRRGSGSLRGETDQLVLETRDHQSRVGVPGVET